MPLKDYNDFFNDHDAEQCRKLERLPKCIECEKPIQDEFAYKFDGEWICETCLNDNHREEVKEDDEF